MYVKFFPNLKQKQKINLQLPAQHVIWLIVSHHLYIRISSVFSHLVMLQWYFLSFQSLEYYNKHKSLLIMRSWTDVYKTELTWYQNILKKFCNSCLTEVHYYEDGIKMFKLFFYSQFTLYVVFRSHLKMHNLSRSNIFTRKRKLYFCLQPYRKLSERNKYGAQLLELYNQHYT